MGKKGRKKKGKKKKKIVVEPDQFTEMDGATLEKQLQNLRENLEDARIKRNIIQIEKDMIHDFYSNTKNQQNDVEAEVKNYETQMENMEDAHWVEIKVYMQWVKHLNYEHSHALETVMLNAEEAQDDELTWHQQTEKEARKTKKEKKEKFKEVDYAHMEMVNSEHNQLARDVDNLKETLDEKKWALIQSYEEKLKKLREELELRLKVEVHEIEEWKNMHYNELMHSHEKSFRDMKNFYTDITRENIKMISIHKNKIE